MTSALVVHHACTARAISPSVGGVPASSSNRAAAMCQRQSPRTTTWAPSGGSGESSAGQSGAGASSGADGGAGGEPGACGGGVTGQSGTAPAVADAIAGEAVTVTTTPAREAATLRPRPSARAALRRAPAGRTTRVAAEAATPSIPGSTEA